MPDDYFLQKLCTNHGYKHMKRSFETDCKYFSSKTGKPSRTKRIFGDGNCILRSVAVAVSGDEENHLAVRGDVGGYIIKHRERCNRPRCWCRLYNTPNELLLEPARNCTNRMPEWTVHNPLMQTGTAPSTEQELVYPSVAFQIEANHCEVVLDVDPPL